MDSTGNLFKEGGIDHPSELMQRYYALAENRFTDFGALSDDDLLAIEALHDRLLGYYKEERRMHFRAFALAAVALLLLLGPIVSGTAYLIPLLIAFGLLLVLLVSYTVVYMRYEEGVRQKMRESLIIENERQRRRERQEGEEP